MALLKIFKNRELVKEVELKVDHSYTLGRGADCTIVLDHSEISRQHVKVDFDGEKWTAVTLARFGHLEVGGDLVDQIFLNDKPRFKVGPFEVQFDEHGTLEKSIEPKSEQNSPEDAPVPEAPIADDFSEKTRIEMDGLKHVLLRLEADGTPYEEITLGLGLIEAGRSRTCEIPLDEEKASRKHFALSFDGQGFVLTDLDSPNGTFVNGKAVKSHRLQSGDEVVVGTSHLRYEIQNPAFENLPAPEIIHTSVAQAPPVQTMQQPRLSHLPAAHQHSTAVERYSPVGSPQNFDYSQGGGPFTEKQSSSNRALIGIAVVGAVIAVLLVNQGDPEKNRNVASNTNDAPAVSAPTDHLSPDQRKYVDDSVRLGVSYFQTGRYELAAIEAEKALKLAPTSSEAKQLQIRCQQAVEIKRQQEVVESKKRKEAEVAARVEGLLDSCEELLQKKQYAQVESCVSRTLDLDPGNERGEKLVSQAQNKLSAIAENRANLAENARAEASALKSLEKAMSLAKEKRYPAAISELEKVENLSFSDKAGTKQKAKQGIANLKDQMRKDSLALVTQGKTALENKEYKNAILKFNEALKLAPNNNEAKDLNEKAQKELRVDMKNMYAESVIEENLGNIESAKKKWRTILEQDVPGDAYFDKAKTKLGKYEK